MDEIIGLKDILRSSPRLWDMLGLPTSAYRADIRSYAEFKRWARDCRPVDRRKIAGVLVYARFLIACFGKKEYIEKLQLKDILKEDTLGPWYHGIQHMIGMSLCDIGHMEEGVIHLRKSANGDTSEARWLWRIELARRLNAPTDIEERLQLADELVREVPEKYKDDSLAIQAKAFIDVGRFSDAAALVPKLSPVFRFIEAELHFAQGDYQEAATVFARYGVSGCFYWWRPQYDYKEAITYLRLGQLNECRQKVLAMRRRGRWDRFYRLQDVERFGVKREASVDNILNSDEPDRCLIDWERLGHYRKMLPPVLRGWAIAHPLVVLTILVGLLFAVFCWIRPPWR